MKVELSFGHKAVISWLSQLNIYKFFRLFIEFLTLISFILYTFILQEFCRLIKIKVNENVFIQLTSQCYLGAVSAGQGPFRGQSGSLGYLQCFKDHYRWAWKLISLFQSPVLFRKYLGPLKSHRNGFVFKICVWIPVFRGKTQFENLILGW